MALLKLELHRKNLKLYLTLVPQIFGYFPKIAQSLFVVSNLFTYIYIYIFFFIVHLSNKFHLISLEM